MKDFFQPIGTLLTHAGFPAGVFVWGGIVVFLIGLTVNGDPRALLGGTALFCFGLMCYYGARVRGGSVSYYGDPEPLVSDWPAFFLGLWWFGCTAVCVWFLLKAFGLTVHALTVGFARNPPRKP